MKAVNIKQVFMWVALILVALLVIGWAAWSSFFAPTKYYAVSLASGEVYFGELHYFPTYGLSQVYTINVNPQNQQQPFSIQKFANTFWGPEDFLNINRDNVVWTAQLSSQSQLADLLRNNPDLLPQQNPQQVPGGNTVPAEGDQVPGPAGADSEASGPSN